MSRPPSSAARGNAWRSRASHAHIADEIQRRGAHEIFVILLVCLEPLAGVVRGERGKEGEGLLGEVTIGHFVGSLVRLRVPIR